MVESRLRILQVCPTDIRGGAEQIASSLLAAYQARGHRSWLAVGEKRGHDPDILRIPNDELRGRWAHFWYYFYSRLHRPARDGRAVALLSRLAGALAEPGRRLDFYRGVEGFDFPGTARLLTLTELRPDILHCHNLHGDYFDLRMLPWLSQQVPLLLTLHDAWLLSGHCAHSFACEKWKTGCGHCPDLTIYPALHRDATAHNWRRKREIYARSRLYVATPSRWLMQKVEQSMLAPGVVEARVLPNGVDLTVFHPADGQEARVALGLPQDAKILLVTGVQLRQNIWKDYDTLRDAVALTSERLHGESLVLVALGEDAPPERIGQAEVRFIPYQTDRETVARYYQAADVYVHAAHADTFPSAVLEALACGRPVVATAVGGIPEQVDNTRTGFLVPAGDAQGLAAHLTHVLSDDHLQQGMGMQAAQTARQLFDFDRQVDAYLNWYAELVTHRA